MRGKWKQVFSMILAVITLVTMSVPVSAQEMLTGIYAGGTVEATGAPESEALEFVADNNYAMVASTTGRAVNTIGLSWGNHIKVEVPYDTASGKIEDKSARYVMTPQDAEGLESSQTKVMIQCLVGTQVYPLRTESGNNYSFADNDGENGRYDGSSEMYIITKTGEQEGILQAVSSGRYATVDGGELRFDEATTAETAERFLFVENPEILDLSFTIEHVATGKYIKTYGAVDTPVTVDGEADDPAVVFSKAVYGTCDSNQAGTVYQTVGFVSDLYGNALRSAAWINNQADATYVLTCDATQGNGWESLQVLPNGDGTVSFKDSYYDQYITVSEGKLAGRLIEEGTTKDQLTDNEKFIIHTKVEPLAVNDLSVDQGSRTETTVDLSWTNPKSLYSDLKLQQKGELGWNEIADVSGRNSYKVENLTAGTAYEFRLVIANGTGEEKLSAEGNEIVAKTRAGAKPATPSGVELEQKGNDFVLTWEASENATEYVIQRADSLFGTYTTIETVTDTTVTVPAGENKYANYYRVIAQKNNDEYERSDVSESVSLEKNLFGENTIILAPTDDTDKIDELLGKLLEQQNDIEKDAQFNSRQWQVYFKPGDYTDTACMYLGFYTSFNGLGKLPTDVKLNNLAIPAYLTEAPNGQGNATCNFWRSAENLSIVNTGNEKGKATHWSMNWRPDAFNWAVAQAAPLRRVASERFVAYDDNYGWASGGYVADCLFTGVDGENGGAGTWSGQQFYTRNSNITGNAYGTTLNNFCQGVLAANLPTTENYETNYQETWKPLESGKGYTNWGVAAADGGQQYCTSINTTDKIAEKPFLFFDEDDHEYKVFVPAVKENTAGTSWGDGKANDGMGEGEILSLDKFYIAHPQDSAATINAQLEAGKNIYFTPGQYHAEVPIEVNKEDTILLGTGMTSVIPDNKEAAVKVADVSGVRIAALILDAGEWSEYLLVVGKKGEHKDHADNPIVLQDLFFRVGGTTNKLTKADNALEINSDDTIGDHFWIWRADHGAGVKWYGNESYHGLIVNGDNVKCYALFNEHFQKYDTLWNGDNGATYFYQNEKCYDPISQDAWMSHKGTVKGYSAYKVANKVKNHYAVGFGIYNVFIYTGPQYNSSEVSIELENAMEVPNRENVRAENICIQTFANAEGAVQSFNHIINGVGPGVASGKDKDGNAAEGYSRKFLLSYHNGTATYGKMPVQAEIGKFIGVETVNNVAQPMNEAGDIDTAVMVGLQNLVKTAAYYQQEDYTEVTWQAFAAAKTAAEEELAKGEDWAVEDDLIAATEALQQAITGLQVKEATDADEIAKKLLEKQREGLKAALAEKKAEKRKKADYPKEAWDAYETACSEAEKTTVTADEIAAAQLKLEQAAVELDAAGISYQRALLQQEILKAAQKKQEDYSEDLWNTYEQALKEARTMFLKEDASLAELKSEKEKLQKVYADMDAELTRVAVDSVSVNPSSVSLKTGETTVLTATVAPANATDQAVTWSTGNANVAAVDADGKVTAVAQGTTTITVTTKDGNKTAACQVTVLASNSASVVAVTGVSLDKTALTLDKGKTAALQATVAPANAANKAVTWTTSNSKVATVDANGTVKAQAKGTAVITVTTADGKYSAACKVTVKVLAKRVKLTTKTIYMVKGSKRTIKAIVTPAGTTDKIKVAKNTKKKIATATVKKSLITIKAKKVGKTTITVKTTSGKSCKCTINVVKKAKKSTAVKLNKKTLKMKKGAGSYLVPALKPKNSTDTIHWSSSNKKVATVDKYGKVTAKKKGTVKITAKTSSGKKATCKITVK